MVKLPLSAGAFRLFSFKTTLFSHYLKKLKSMRHVFLPLFLLASALVFGQRSAEVGVFLGASNYQGDFAKSPVSFNETNAAFGLAYQRFIDPQWAIKGSATFGKISGSDRNLEPIILKDRDWSFQSNIFEVAGHLQFHPFGKARYNQVGRLQKHLSPYASLGLGLAFADSKLEVPTDDLVRSREPDDRSIFFAVPISAGLRYVMSEKLTLTAEFGQRATFSDYLDGVSRNGNPDYKDWYMFFGFGITYSLMAEY